MCSRVIMFSGVVMCSGVVVCSGVVECSQCRIGVEWGVCRSSLA